MLQIASILPIAALIPLWALIPLSFLAAFTFWLFHWPASNMTIEPRRASSFKAELIPTRIDTIVIGSGSGGCACANMLAQAGQRVLVLEQHSKTGGCTHSFRINNCEWDTGLHYTSLAMGTKTRRPGALMHFMTKGLQKWTPLDDPYDEVVFPQDDEVGQGLPNSSSYSFVRGKERTIDAIMSKIDPNNHDLKIRVRAYMDLCEEINHGFTALGLSRILPSWLHFLVKPRIDRLMAISTMTVRDVQHAMLKLGYTVDRLLEEGCPKCPEEVESDPTIRRLKAVLTHPIGDYAVQPRQATMAAHGVTMAHYMDGACYSVGATQQISVRSTSLVRAFGGEVLVDATVNEILVENGHAIGVKVCNTSTLNGCSYEAECGTLPLVEIRAKNVVCATSVYNLYNKLLPQDLPAVKDFHDPSKRSIRQSNGHIFLFCKIKGDANNLQLPTHNLWYFNGYDMDKAFDEYFANPTGERPPTVYIGFPCTKDTTWKKRFPGVSNCILISDGLWEWFEKWQHRPVHNRGTDYEQFKEKLSKHLLDILYETVPACKGKVEYHTLGTPLTEVTYLASFNGGSYGTMCLPSMFAEKNRKWTTTPFTPIPNLFLAGSDAFLPAVCGAMHGGVFGASAVLGHLRTMKLTLSFMADFSRSIKEENPKLWWIQAYAMAWYKFINE